MSGAAVTTPGYSVERLVVRAAVTVREEASLTEVALTMRAADVSAAMVLPGPAIVTERDLTRAWAARLSPDEPVGTIASSDLLVVAADTPIAEAAAVMLNHDIRHLVVAMPDGTEGEVSLRAVMAVLLQACNPEVWLATMRVRVVGPSEIWLG